MQGKVASYVSINAHKSKLDISYSYYTFDSYIGGGRQSNV